MTYTGPNRRSRIAPRDRCLIPLASDERRAGFVAFGMSRPCPRDASPEFRAGYAEHRESVMNHLCAMEEA
jgi:hypothetical protein